MDKNKLRSIMTLHGDRNCDIANALGISEQSFSCKINENGTQFKQSEIAAIRDRYNLNADEITAIFFD